MVHHRLQISFVTTSVNERSVTSRRKLALAIPLGVVMVGPEMGTVAWAIARVEDVIVTVPERVAVVVLVFRNVIAEQALRSVFRWRWGCALR
jgi:hypothetical protein